MTALEDVGHVRPNGHDTRVSLLGVSEPGYYQTVRGPSEAGEGQPCREGYQ
jgi:hypothetical protein